MKNMGRTKRKLQEIGKLGMSWFRGYVPLGDRKGRRRSRITLWNIQATAKPYLHGLLKLESVELPDI